AIGEGGGFPVLTGPTPRPRASTCAQRTRGRGWAGRRSRRQAPVHWAPERRRAAASSSSARSDRLGVRAYPGAARAPSERLRAGRLLGALVRALRLQALGAAA